MRVHKPTTIMRIKKAYIAFSRFYKEHTIIFWIISVVIAFSPTLNFTIRQKAISAAKKFIFPSIQTNAIFLAISLITLVSLLIFLYCNRTKLNDTEKVIYGELIKEIQKLDLNNWDRWMSEVLSPYCRIRVDKLSIIRAVRERVIKIKYPKKLKKFEISIKNLSEILYQIREALLEHSNIDREYCVGEKFYKIDEWNPERYHKLAEEYDKWTDKIDNLIFEATRAVNWFSDVVRDSIDPFFYTTKGRFSVTLDGGLEYRMVCFEYSKKEKKQIMKRIKRNRKRI